MKTIKLFSTLALHALVFVLFFLCCDFASSLGVNLSLGRRKTYLLLFCIVYYTLQWLALYSQPYHYYLMNSLVVVARNMTIAFGILLALELASCVRGSDKILDDLASDTLLLLLYIGLHLSSCLWIRRLARLGFFRKNVMLVGSCDKRVPIERLFQNIKGTNVFLGQLTVRNGSWHYRASMDSAFEPIAKGLENFLFAKHVNELIICMDADLESDAILRCARWCRNESIGYYLIPDIAKLPAFYPWGMSFSSIPQIERYCPNRDSLMMISVKRLFDVFVSSLSLILLSPVFLVISLCILLEDGGPIFYVSKRVGIHGRIIRFVKFRSMVKDAEKRKAELLKHNERPDGPLFKMKDDPRVTRVGAFLRKTSLDEIPQFWNVLKGDMSLVGPRPHLPEEVAQYSDRDNLRLECIPGIACLPQIRGRNTLGFREWVFLDLEYRKHWSISYDLKTLFCVAKTVLSANSEGRD